MVVACAVDNGIAVAVLAAGKVAAAETGSAVGGADMAAAPPLTLTE